MFALLPESHRLARGRCPVDALSPRILFTREMSDATKKAICMPELVVDEYSLELAGRVGDRLIRTCIGEGSRRAVLSECWHSVHWTG